MKDDTRDLLQPGGPRRRLRLALSVLILLLPAASPPPSRAQAPPVESPITFDSSFGEPGPAPTQPFGANGLDHRIEHTRGQMAGDSTLLHSFDRFGIPAGDAATFTGPAAIDQVLARVTGGDESHIDGLLRSEIESADLYLLNPAGLIFGPGARLDVQGSFHASTADELEFGGGQVFEARADGAVPLLTVASPAEFGFLDANTAPIRIAESAPGSLHISTANYVELDDSKLFETDLVEESPISDASPVAFGFLSKHPAPLLIAGASLVVPEGETLSLIAGDIDIWGPGISAPRELGLLSVDSIQEFASHFSDPAAAIEGLRADPERLLRSVFAGDLTIDPSAFERITPLNPRTPVPPPSRPTLLAPGGRIRITGVGSPGRVDTAGHLSGFQQLGSLRLSDGAFVSVEGASDGEIVASGGDLAFRDSILSADHFGEGYAGEIAIDARGTFLSDGSEALIARDEIAVSVFDPTFDVDFFSFVPVEIGLPPVRIVRGPVMRARGLAGRISVEAGDVLLTRGSGLEVFGAGDAGGIFIDGASVRVADLAEILSTNFGQDVGGRVSIRAAELQLEDGASVRSVTGDGNGADIEIVASDGAMPSSTGPVFSEGGRVRMIDGAEIVTANFGRDVGGRVSIRAAELQLQDGASLRSETYGPTNGGDIDIVATEGVTLSGAGPLFSQGNSSITALTFGSGDSGNVHVRAPVLLVRDGTIETGTTDFTSTGRGGSLTIEVADLRLESLALITTGTSGGGDGGDLRITAERGVTVSGREFLPGIPALEQAQGITTSTSRGDFFRALKEGFARGNAGDLHISTPSLSVIDNGVVGTTSFFSSGAAGDIHIDVERLCVRGGGVIDSGTGTFGAAGDITIDASESVAIVGASALGIPSRVRAFTAGVQDGGEVAISTPVLIVGGGAIVTTSLGFLERLLPTGSGDAGAVSIDAREIIVREGGLIDSSTFGTGDGGVVALGPSGPVGHITVGGGESAVQSQTVSAGSSGRVEVNAQRLEVANGGQVASRTGAGSGAVRRVFRDAELLFQEVLDFLGVDPDEFFGDHPDSTGAGGSILLTIGEELSIVDGLVTAESIGLGDAGDVMLAAPVIDLSEGSRVAAEATGDGDAGSVGVTSQQLRLHGSEITTAARGGLGGSIGVDLEERLELVASSITASVTDGVGGSVSIGPAPGSTGPLLVTLKGSEIAARATEAGDAGSIEVQSQTVDLTGSRLTSEAVGGRGGDVTIAVGESLLLTGSEIAASVGGGEPGGDVVLGAREIEISEGSRVAAESTGAGDAGLIEITAAESLHVLGSQLATDAADGAGGRIGLAAGDLLRIEGSAITGTVGGARVGGDLVIAGRAIELLDGSSVSVQSTGSGNAGSIGLAAAESMRIEGSRVVTDATVGSGGNISARAPGRIDLVGTELTASVGAGEGGSVLIDPMLLLLEDSTVRASAAELEGRGGRIVVVADLVLATRDGQPVPLSEVFDASARGGPELSGTVEIHSPDVDLAGTLTALPASFLDASSLLAERCAARGGASSGSFVARGRSGVPGGPEGLLPGYAAASLPPFAGLPVTMIHAAGPAWPAIAWSCR
jgi:filamentous hemagglutinin family protein